MNKIYTYDGLMIFRKIEIQCVEECKTIGHGYRATATN